MLKGSGNTHLSMDSRLNDKPFSKISVRDITTAAEINRGTFYLHYLDKYDLLEKIEQKLLDELAQVCVDLQPGKVLQEARKGELSQFSMQVFHYINEQDQKYKILLSSNNQSGFMKRLQRFLAEQFSEKYTDHQVMANDPELPARYLAAFAASAFLGIIEEWLTTEDRESPAQMAEYFVRIILAIQSFND